MWENEPIANDERPEDEGDKLFDCEGDLCEVVSVDLEEIEFDMMLSNANPVRQQWSNWTTNKRKWARPWR